MAEQKGYTAITVESGEDEDVVIYAGAARPQISPSTDTLNSTGAADAREVHSCGASDEKSDFATRARELREAEESLHAATPHSRTRAVVIVAAVLLAAVAITYYVMFMMGK